MPMWDFSLHNQNMSIKNESIHRPLTDEKERTLFAEIVFNRLKIASMSDLVGSSIVVQE